MAVKYGKFEMPQYIDVNEELETPTYAKFVAEPFERGFGHTIGNSMRRLILSSLEAPAIVSVRIEGVPHEFMAIEGIVEDVTDIILNFKCARLRKLTMDDQASSRDIRAITKVIEVTQEELDKNHGNVPITLGRIISAGTFEVVNPDLHIFTVTKPMSRQIDLKVAIGRGYVPSERIELRDKAADEIVLDASFSPVSLVNYAVEKTRVGQDTDFEKLILEVTTDGRVTPKEAVTFAAQILQKHLEVFNKIKTHALTFDEKGAPSTSDRDLMMEKLALRIDEIELSVRSTNCLKGANIETIAELVTLPEKKMLEFRNFGKKSLNEIKAKLTDMSLHLGMDLAEYGIDESNVKQKMKVYHESKKSKRELNHSDEE